jgi:glycosyltransferase involved in cell wall biosynthesis
MARRMPGRVDSVKDGGTGIPARPRDPRSSAAALMRLPSDEELRERLGSAGRALVKERFSESAVCARIMGEHSRLVAQQWPGCRGSAGSVR